MKLEKTSCAMGAEDWKTLRRLQSILLFVTVTSAMASVWLWHGSLSIGMDADRYAEATQRVQRQNQAFLRAGEQAGLVLSEDRARLLEAEVQIGHQLLRHGVFSWTRFLNDFEETVSSGISILSIELNAKDGGLHVKGHALRMSTLTTFAGSLQTHPRFSDVALVEHAEERGPDKTEGADYMTFHMIMTYRGVERSDETNL